MKKIMVKKFSVLLSLMIILLFPLTFSSCRGTGPWELEGVVWYSEDPVMEFVKMGEIYWEGTALVNVEKIKVNMLWSHSYSFDIVDAEKDKSGAFVEEMTLVSGKFDYRKGDVVLTVNEDKLFNNKYDKIILKYRDLTESEKQSLQNRDLTE